MLHTQKSNYCQKLMGFLLPFYFFAQSAETLYMPFYPTDGGKNPLWENLNSLVAFQSERSSAVTSALAVENTLFQSSAALMCVLRV